MVGYTTPLQERLQQIQKKFRAQIQQRGGICRPFLVYGLKTFFVFAVTFLVTKSYILPKHFVMKAIITIIALAATTVSYAQFNDVDYFDISENRATENTNMPAYQEVDLRVEAVRGENEGIDIAAFDAPESNYVRIQLDDARENEVFVRMRTLKGDLVHEQILDQENNALRLDMSLIADGHYTLDIENQNNAATSTYYVSKVY